MTTLYNMPVKRTKHYVVHHHVAGDLSHTFEVRSPEMVGLGPGWVLQGVGIATRNLKEADMIGRLIEKHGYNRAYEIHQRKIMSSGYSFGYLPDSKLARELAPFAYGDYAERIRRKHKIRKED